MRIIGMTLSILTLFSAVAFGAEPTVHTATCNDGKEYYTVDGSHRFACAGHKGVKAWTDGSAVKTKASGPKTRAYK